MARNISGRRKTGAAAGSSGGNGGDFRPSRDDILRYVTENPDRAGKREIAKAFSLKAGDRIWLKDMLRDMQDEGLLQKGRKRLSRPGALPHVTVLDIFGRDPDGGLLGRPAERTVADDTQNPVVAIAAPRGMKGPVPGIGDRVLAKTFASRDESGPAYTARIMKVLDRRAEAVLGVLRVARDGAFHIEPVERRQAQLVVEPEFLNGAVAGDLVEAEPQRGARYGLPRAKVLTVLGSMTSEKAVSMIAIHAHDIPHIFPQAVLDEAAAARKATLAGRDDWRNCRW